MSYTSTSSAYVILINEDHTMTVSQKRRIMQRSKLMDDLWFLVSPMYNGHNMEEFTLLLEYLLPVSRKYKTEFLTLSEDNYNGYLKYTLPFDTCITSEAGDVKLQISFITTDLDENGMGVQRVRKIAEASIYITPISAWSDIIPDCALSALDQRIIKMDAQIKAIGDVGAFISESKADNIAYDVVANELQLMSGGKAIGDKVSLTCEMDKDGMPIVEFATVESDTGNDSSNDVVEF